jgi:hypothetical protein
MAQTGTGKKKKDTSSNQHWLLPDGKKIALPVLL